MSAPIGFVYILGNEYMPDVFKIGCTERSPRHRADELSNATGVPVPFQVLCYAEFEGFQAVERQLHEWCSQHRVNAAREFFHQCLPDAVSFLWFHPGRIAFTDATAGRAFPWSSELVNMACKEKHETYFDDLPNPWKRDTGEEADRIARLKRYAQGDFGHDDEPEGAEILNVVPQLDTPDQSEVSDGEPVLRLVAGGPA